MFGECTIDKAEKENVNVEPKAKETLEGVFCAKENVFHVKW